MSERKLRICIVLEPSGGGSGRHVLDLTSGLAHLGHDVTVIWSPIRAEPGWVQGLKNLKNVRNIAVDMYRSIGVRDFKSLKDLGETIKRTGPYDVIHGHSAKAGALVRLLSKSIPGHRVYTPHAFITMDPNVGVMKRMLFARIERLLSATAHSTIAVSEVERQHAAHMKMKGELIKVVNGAGKNKELSRSVARQKLNVKDGEFAVGFVGRLTYQKNPERFMSIIQHAVDMCPRIKGIVIGDGELREALANDAERDRGRFNFLGWQDAAALMTGLDAFLMTSRYEAMPYTLIEALMAGLPIISTDVGGVEETITQNENGYVFSQEASNEEIGTCIASLAKDISRHKYYSQVSHELSKAFTIETMVENTLAVYGKAINIDKKHMNPHLDAKL